MRRALVITLLPLAARGQSAADDQADRLDNAAAQSNPGAATVLGNAAVVLREKRPADPQAQKALQAAGNAEVAASPGDAQTQARREGHSASPRGDR
jgi:hypothetical protein